MDNRSRKGVELEGVGYPEAGTTAKEKSDPLQGQRGRSFRNGAITRNKL